MLEPYHLPIDLVFIDRNEFERVLATCASVELRDKSPDYVQGLIVGRLVESDPALAKRLKVMTCSSSAFMLST